MAEVERALPAVAGPKIGSDGRLMEWNEEFKENEPGHRRHTSHLFCLASGAADHAERHRWNSAAAARKASKVDWQRAAGTRVGVAWIINFWARLGDGDQAGEIFRRCWPSPRCRICSIRIRRSD